MIGVSIVGWYALKGVLMAVQVVPWHPDPHTLRKHDLYREYLSRWMPIITQHWKEGGITYAEGFAGPGIYADGSPGSPVIALRSLLDRPDLGKNSRNIRFLFMDKDPQCTTLLRAQLDAVAGDGGVAGLAERGIVIDIVTGDCRAELRGLLDRHGVWDRPCDPPP